MRQSFKEHLLGLPPNIRNLPKPDTISQAWIAYAQTQYHPPNPLHSEPHYHKTA